MSEIIINLHMHTRYSDGSGSHLEIAQAALRCGLDAVIVTDHNVYVEGPEKYYESDGRRVLLLVGEEIHDPTRRPEKSHLLVFGAGEELSHLAPDLALLLKTVAEKRALAFVAHPFDPAAPLFDQTNLSWEDWQVQNLTGLEIWNGDSEFKSLLTSYIKALFYAFQPKRIPRGPFPAALQKWDALLETGQRLFAIGGSDAHAMLIPIGPIRRTIFPYDYHFRTINTHLLTDRPLTGELEADRERIYTAMRLGRCFVANDLPASARGFSFTASGFGRKVTMGDEISAERGVTFQIRLPQPAVCRLVCHGQVIQSWQNQSFCTYITTRPGAYRVEVFVPYKGRLVGWIYSNPIFVRSGNR